MILSDATILERMSNAEDTCRRIVIYPLDENAIQGASVDLRLGNTILYRGQTIHLAEDQYFTLPPHGVCLAATYEHIVTPCDCVARVEGKSSLGRQFIIVHCTAGWCDPGFAGVITLELVNHDPNHSKVFKLYDPICQLTFLQLDRPAVRQYKGKYQNDMTVSAAKR